MHATAVAQWAHDIRNALGTMSPYLETLERPSEPDTIRVVALANALIARAASMCNDAVNEAAIDDTTRRRRFDVMDVIKQVFDLIAPTVPAATKLHVKGNGPVFVMADPQDVFRILFNLVHNAMTVARQSNLIRRIDLIVEVKKASAKIRIVDDGPGLPESVRANLFRRGTSTTGGTGYGISIARELAERNGGMLELSRGSSGTSFVLELQSERAMPKRPVTHRPDAWLVQPSFA